MFLGDEAVVFFIKVLVFEQTDDSTLKNFPQLVIQIKWIC